jgi:arsenite methyltransferase
MQPDNLRAIVQDKYAAVARGEALSCCGPTGCSEEIDMIGDAYAGVEGYFAEADLGLGCGLPVEHAGLAPGQTVLDLGAGAGLDAFVARGIVGDTGRVLGVDFTPEMVAKARANAAKLGYDNVAFEHGDIEALPFADASVDVVISNCVLNLVPDKARAFAELARVLRPGGHFCVSDVVSRGELPATVRASAELYAGCVAGALDEARYLDLLRAAGFEHVEVVKARPITLPADLLPDGTAMPLWSVTVRGVRPSAIPSTAATTQKHTGSSSSCCGGGRSTRC